GARVAEQRRHLFDERPVQVAELAARLETADQFRGRGDADVGRDQRLLEPLPRLLVARIERGGRELLRQRAPALAERFAQAPQEEREQERDRAERLLAAGEEREACDALAGRPQLDLDAGLAVLGLGQAEAALPAGKQRRGDLREVVANGGEGLLEPALDRV